MTIHDIFHRDKSARGRFNDETKEVTILSGSILKIDLDVTPPSNIAGNYREVKERIAIGDLRRRADGRLDVVRDICVRSPSCARVFADGKAGSGWTAWHLEADGKLLDTLRLPVEHSLAGSISANSQYDKQYDERESDNMTDTTTDLHPLNQILYGPPGTGKTHHTINETLAILDPTFLSQNRTDREKLRARFCELERSEHVRFVTFHQSFSYEDFVEGLRAEPNEATGQLMFAPVDGVLKTICQAAATKIVVDEVPELDLSGSQIWKMSLGGKHNDENYIYEECVEKGRILLGWGAGIDFTQCKSKADIIESFQTAKFAHTTADYAVTAVNAFVLGMKIDDVVVISDGNSKFRAVGQITGNYEFVPRTVEDDEFTQCRQVRWLKVFDPPTACSTIMSRNFMMKAIYRLSSDAIDRRKLNLLLSTKSTDKKVPQGPNAKVLIIDEINRGNISRIFGELITLIEPSKRAGNGEALSVTLPYSKKLFSIPNNLYLIGTMNTADRSLSSLDIALRRRFVFKEMPPDPAVLAGIVVEGIKINRLLEIMNQRIEALLDREHCLGHAYFMPLDKDPSIDCLARIFEQQILPLLKEYFFEDWERIGWVLNDHRKSEVNRFVLRAKADVASLFGDDFEGRVQEKIWEINKDAFERVPAYLGVINHADMTRAPTAQLIDGTVECRGYQLERSADTTIKVYQNGIEQRALPVLRDLANQLGISVLNSMGNPFNTRQLGQRVISAIRIQQ